jgi:hypothetical protein
VEQDLVLNPFDHNILKKVCSDIFNQKHPNSQHYAHNVFFREAFCNIYLALLKNGHLYSCPFSPSDAISFLDFLESDRIGILKGSQLGASPPGYQTKHYLFKTSANP